MQADYTIDYIKRALSSDSPLEKPDQKQVDSKIYPALELLYESHREGGSARANTTWQYMVGINPKLKRYAEGEMPEQENRKQPPPDDDEIALAIADQWDNLYGFFHAEWRLYEGGCWRVRQLPEIQRDVRRFLRQFRRQGVQVTQSRIKAITSMLRDEVFITDRDVIDTAAERKQYIPLRNGVYNVDTMTLEPHRADLYFTNQLSFEYNPIAQCPNFMRFLHSSLVIPGTSTTDEEMVSFVQEALAYSMTARTDMKASFWLYGEPDSGKSTLLSVIRALMGDLHTTIDLNMLGGNRFMLGGIVGKRVVTFSEADQGVVLPDGLYKALVGGSDEVFADVKNRPAVIFTPEAKLWWAMNNTPRTTDRSGATTNRLRPILFTRTIPKSERIAGLDGILASECAGIFNWLLVGYRRLVTTGKFTSVIAAERWLEEYKLENDTELSFINDACERDLSSKLQARDLYTAYANWCMANGFKPKNINQVSRDWLRIGLEKTKANGRYWWHGVRMKNEKF